MRNEIIDMMTNLDVNAVAKEIDTNGYSTIPNFLTGTEISELSSFAETVVDASDGEFVDIRNDNDLSGILKELPTSNVFRDMCYKLASGKTGRDAPKLDIYNVVRFLKGLSGREASLYFHYDSYVVTAILPIAIPKDQGALLLKKRTRKIRKLYLLNLIDKMFVERRSRQAKLSEMAHTKSEELRTVQLVPGNLYLFWGYQTIHTNLPCDPQKLRATAVYHYGDPHHTSILRSLIRRYRGVEFA